MPRHQPFRRDDGSPSALSRVFERKWDELFAKYRDKPKDFNTEGWEYTAYDPNMREKMKRRRWRW